MASEAGKRRRTSVDDSKPASANYHANALARGLAVLEMVAERSEPLTLNELSREAALPKSTLVRLLAVLAEMEYLVRVDERPAYRLGHKVQGLATSYLSTLDLSTATAPYLRPLAAATGQTANLGVIDGKQVLHVCVAEPDRPLRFRTGLGARDDLYCTGLGKLLLSELPAGDLPLCLPPEPFPGYTDTTFTSVDALRRDLARTRRRGYALDDNERSTGLRCVAVERAGGRPVPGRGERVRRVGGVHDGAAAALRRRAGEGRRPARAGPGRRGGAADHAPVAAGRRRRAADRWRRAQPRYAMASISTRTSGCPKARTTVVRAGGGEPTRRA